MHDRTTGAGAEGFWPDTLPTLRRPEPPAVGSGPAGAVVRVRVLGKPEIVGVPADLHVRPSAVEFLTYLIVRGGSAHQQDIADDLMPDPSERKAAGRKVAQRMHTYTYNLRQIFTRLGGDRGCLQLRRHRYVLDRAGFDVDLWTMLDAASAASAASDPWEKIAALRRAVDAYRGPFADGAGYLWSARYQDLVRREYVDAVIALAGCLAAPARAVLSQGQRHHPDDERLTAAMNGFSPG